MIRDVHVCRTRYAPGQPAAATAQDVMWTQERQGRSGAYLLCPEVVEVRFACTESKEEVQIRVRGRLCNGEGTEWVLTVPTTKFGLFEVPVGFGCEQRVTGAVYRLPKPRTLRIHVDPMPSLPVLTFFIQVVN